VHPLLGVDLPDLVGLVAPSPFGSVGLARSNLGKPYRLQPTGNRPTGRQGLVRVELGQSDPDQVGSEAGMDSPLLQGSLVEALIEARARSPAVGIVGLETWLA
jgi:hypothetical protein